MPTPDESVPPTTQENFLQAPEENLLQAHGEEATPPDGEDIQYKIPGITEYQKDNESASPFNKSTTKF